MKKQHWVDRKTTCAAVSIVLSLVACAKSFDMSGERLTPLGPEWGVVIGSVLVKSLTSENENSLPAADINYAFKIVQSSSGDPHGTSPYAEQYGLQVKTGEERTFVSRLRTGRYLVKHFSQERLTGIGGDLDLVIESKAGEVRYVGRLLVEVPERALRGKAYRFSIENAREATLARLPTAHAELTAQVVDAPMRLRERSAP